MNRALNGGRFRLEKGGQEPKVWIGSRRLCSVQDDALLFESGVADSRGCEYREIEVEGPGQRGMEASKARGFVLPERPGEPRRFAVGWDGVLHSVLTAGAKADLDADVRTLAAALRKSRESPKFRERTTVEAVTGKKMDHREAISPGDFRGHHA